MEKFTFDIQLFAEESEGYTIDQAVEMLNGTQPEPVEPEPIEPTEPIAEPTEPAVVDPEPTEPEPAEPTEPETPAIDYNLKVKFKANGQEVEKSIQDLINDAQLGSNYNAKMQDLANQRKAYEAAQQQQQAAPEDPLKAFEDLNNKVTARAMQMLNLKDPAEFEPDAMGIMGSKVHYAAYQKALLDIQQEDREADMQKTTQQFTERQCEERYGSFFQEAAKDKEQHENVIQVALQKLDEIAPIIKGGDLDRAVTKTFQREQYYQDMQTHGRSNVQPLPFTPAELDALTKFYNDCKAEYVGKPTKAQVKAAVPKSVPIKPTVKVESTTNNDPAPAKKMDFKKIREMDLDDIAKML